MSQVLDTPRYKYKRIRVRGKDGVVRYSANNGDPVARLMLGAGKDELVKTMAENGLTERLGPHSTKNAGHFRMVLGQALRMLVKKKLPITIGGVEVRSLTQKVPLPHGYKEEKIKPRKHKIVEAMEEAVAIAKGEVEPASHTTLFVPLK